jgi:NAD-dependent deacetylase
VSTVDFCGGARGQIRSLDAGATLVIVNRDPTPYDELAAEVIRTDIVEAVPAIVDRLVGART